MSEALSGLVQQVFQHTLENQSVHQQTQTMPKKASFESYLQKEQAIPDPVKTTSGVELDQKLDQMQMELAEKLKQTEPERINSGELPKELLDSKTRLGLLKEAYSKMGETTTVSSGFEGRLMQTEMEYKQVEALMMSDNNLSPGELLALQARLYQVSQHIEVMSKVVDQMAGGIKTILNTNL